MEALERNRVFSANELENLKKDTTAIMNLASDISRDFNTRLGEVLDILSSLPSGIKKCSAYPQLCSYSGKDFVYQDYEETAELTVQCVYRAVSEIPQKDTETAGLLKEVRERVCMAGQMAEELKEMLNTENLSLSAADYRSGLLTISGAGEEIKRAMGQKIKELGITDGMVYTGDPVNVLSGNFVLQETDLFTAGVPFLSMQRTYNSLNRKKGIFGRGWSFSHETVLCKKEASAEISLPDGSREIFARDLKGWKNTDEDSSAELMETCLSIKASGVKETRDRFMRLSTRTYPGGVSSTYTYGTNGRIQDICHKRGEETLESIHYEYDPAGNIRTAVRFRKGCPKETGNYTYTYDRKGRLVKTEKDGKTLREYSYDPYGNRTDGKNAHSLKVCYTGEKNLHTVKSVCLKKTDTEKEYRIDRDGEKYSLVVRNLPEAVITDSGTEYLLTDHLGSVLRVMDEEGHTKSVYAYDEYGKSLGEEPVYAGYAGYIPAGEGCYAAGRRYYDTEAGRFLTKDILAGNTANPQSFNRYAYAVGNPVRYRDASGCSPEEPVYHEGGSTTAVITDGGAQLLQEGTDGSISGIGKGNVKTVAWRVLYPQWAEHFADRIVHSSVADFCAGYWTDYLFSRNPELQWSARLYDFLCTDITMEEIEEGIYNFERGYTKELLMEALMIPYGIFTFPEALEALGTALVTMGPGQFLKGVAYGIIEGGKGLADDLINGDAITRGEAMAQLTVMAVGSVMSVQGAVKGIRKIGKLAKKGASALKSVKSGASVAAKAAGTLDDLGGAGIVDDVVESGTYSILSYEDAENIAFDAIHGPNNADAVVLGKYGNGGPTAYTSVAKDMDAQYFQLDNWDELATRYSDDEIWKINEKFLNIQTSSGREIYLSHNPEDYLGKGQFYSRELQYLLDNGYKFVAEGGIWHAIRQKFL